MRGPGRPAGGAGAGRVSDSRPGGVPIRAEMDENTACGITIRSRSRLDTRPPTAPGGRFAPPPPTRGRPTRRHPSDRHLIGARGPFLVRHDAGLPLGGASLGDLLQREFSVVLFPASPLTTHHHRGRGTDRRAGEHQSQRERPAAPARRPVAPEPTVAGPHWSRMARTRGPAIDRAWPKARRRWSIPAPNSSREELRLGLRLRSPRPQHLPPPPRLVDHERRESPPWLPGHLPPFGVALPSERTHGKIGWF